MTADQQRAMIEIITRIYSCIGDLKQDGVVSDYRAKKLDDAMRRLEREFGGAFD